MIAAASLPKASKMALMTTPTFSRRWFLAMSATLPWALSGLRFPAFAMTARPGAPALGAASGSIPIGLELYSVRDALAKDPEGTVRAVAQMGYQAVEFYAPYFKWTDTQAQQMRKLMDDLGIRCYSTHNDEDFFSAQNIDRARDLNLILGTKYMVQAWSDPKPTLDAWKALAENLNAVAAKLAPSGLKVGYHNHDAEWKTVEGKRPIEVIAQNTKPEVMLQLDVGTCLEAGADPVAWIRANPGRIHSIHLKDWSPDPRIGYKTLFGEGIADWKGIFRAAETVGGIEYYLIEQEGSQYSELETVKRCLEAYRKTHG